MFTITLTPTTPTLPPTPGGMDSGVRVSGFALMCGVHRRRDRGKGIMPMGNVTCSVNTHDNGKTAILVCLVGNIYSAYIRIYIDSPQQGTPCIASKPFTHLLREYVLMLLNRLCRLELQLSCIQTFLGALHCSLHVYLNFCFGQFSIIVSHTCASLSA